jgi:hypothetical protein
MIPARWPGFIGGGNKSSWRKTHCRTAILLYWVHLANLPESYCCIIIPISAITIKIVSMIAARWPGVLNTTV